MGKDLLKDLGVLAEAPQAKKFPAELDKSCATTKEDEWASASSGSSSGTESLERCPELLRSDHKLLEKVHDAFLPVALKAMQELVLPAIVDMLGFVTAYKPVSRFKSYDGIDMAKRVITIADELDNSFVVTLWGDHAWKSVDKNDMVACRGVAVAERGGQRTGSLMPDGEFEVIRSIT